MIVRRNLNIDFMKAVAILSVILIHMTSTDQELILGAPYYYLQAMPIFMIISGYNSASSYLNRAYSILQNPESRIQNPESRIQNPESRSL